MNMLRGLLLGLSVIASPAVVAADGGCAPPQVLREASYDDVRAFFRERGLTVLTFLGYSGAGYEDEPRMLAKAAEVLDGADPRRTLVNIGATLEGIGAVYALAKQRGFATAGIVSTQARDAQVPIAPCVDYVFFVKDQSWGGLVPGTTDLSPTSRAMVDNSDVVVAIGGGEVARDELRAARDAGKQVRFIAAEMNRAAAIEKARKKGEPPPADFRGAAAGALD